MLKEVEDIEKEVKKVLRRNGRENDFERENLKGR